MKKKIFKASSFLSLVLAMSTMTTQAQQVDSTATNAKDSTKKVDKVMDEVVVVAYGSQRVKNLTGSMATVGGALLADKPFSSVDKALQGQVAGLQVSSGSGAAGSSTDVRLRGIGSISASSSPLWVIDGVIASSGDWSSNTTTQNVLSSLNPDDIASITVLKDAAATAIYGSRAANGVIIVTTKKGQAGTTKVNFVGQWGANSRAFFNQNNRPMTTSEYMKAFDMALQNAGTTNSYASSADYMVNEIGMDTTVNTNWYNLVNRTGNQAQYNLSLSGGNEKTQFYASSGYFTQDASTINSNFKRYNGSINVHHKASDRLTLDIGLNGAYSKQQTPMNGGAYGNPNLAAYFVPSWYSPYQSDGSLNYGTDEFPTGGGVFNPLVIAAYDKYTSSQFTMRGFVSGKYQILNNLSFTSKFSSEYFDLNEYQYNNPLYGDGYNLGGAAYAYDTKVFNYTWTNLFNYKLNLNSAKDINLDITAGQEAYKHNYNILTAAGKIMPQNLEKQDLTVAGVPTAATTGKSYNAMNSYLANAVLNIKDRYVLSGSFRRDGSSVFGANHRWGNFFSVGGAWNINNEDFLKNNTWIDVLKLRASYGENGNAIGFGDYSSIQSYNYGSNYNNQAGMIISNVGNPDLTWEKNKIFDIGIDWGFLHNRLSGSIDYYNRATSNLLIWVPLSYTTGYYNSTTPSQSGELMNVGSMRNRGIELTINGTPIKTKDFSWDVSFNISHNNNKVTKLYNGNPISNGQFRITEGHNIQEYYLREWAGVDKTNGNALWYTNGADTATTSNINNASYSLTGKSAMPKYFGGFTNTFTYKNFSLTAVFNYNFGNYVEDSWANYYNSDGTYYGGFQQSNLQLQAWTPTNTNTNVPKLVYGNSSNSRSLSTRFLYKGNYIRLRTVQFDYRLPKTVLAKFKLTSVDFFFSATNWLTFATDKNIPFDPESGVNATTNLNIPINKTITGGVKIGL